MKKKIKQHKKSRAIKASYTKELRRMRSERLRKYWEDKKNLEALSKRTKKYWADPKNRTKHREFMKKWNNKPENLKWRSAMLKKFWAEQPPQVRERFRALFIHTRSKYASHFVPLGGKMKSTPEKKNKLLLPKKRSVKFKRLTHEAKPQKRINSYSGVVVE